MNIGDNSKVLVSVENLSKNDKTRLSKIVKEMSYSFSRQEAERDLQKDMLDEMQNEIGIEKKLVRQIARAYHKQNVEEVREFNSRFDATYDEIVASSTEE